MSLEQIKEILLQRGAIADNKQNLVAEGIIMKSTFGLAEGANVFVDGDLEGGKKKKRKKKKSTPKKRKENISIRKKKCTL